MNKIDKLKITNKGVIKDNFYDLPKDELDEFSNFEMELKRFCFNYNHCIAIEIGDITKTIHLYYDVLDAIEDGLCLNILELAKGKNIIINFNDFLLYMNPDLALKTINSKLEILGTKETYQKILSLPETLEKIHFFIDKIFSCAVNKNYLNQGDIFQYLGWDLNDNTESLTCSYYIEDQEDP
jgi:hypothetical protein